ncbi:hypothetical protein MMC31_005186 [Peltigera leucophlebia]|nr:hypothetical protein [Peltigera leucophlebia]
MSSQNQSFSEDFELSSEDSEEFEVNIKKQLMQPKFHFMASICGTMQEGEHIPLALHDLCLEMYEPDHPVATCVSNLTLNINQTFSAIAVLYPAYEIIEKSQRKRFEKDEDTPEKFSQREVQWARRLMEIFEYLEKELEALLTDTEKIWKKSSSNQSYFAALASDKRTGPLRQEMIIWAENMKQLHEEVMCKQQGRVQDHPLSYAQSPKTQSEVHPLKPFWLRQKELSYYESGEDNH